MIRQMLRYLGTLFALQAVFGGIVFFLSDVRVLALAGSVAFLALVWVAGRGLADDLDQRPGPVAGAAFLTGLLWQIPGYQGSLRFASDTIGWSEYDGITDLQDFAMETWHTVLLPLLAAIPPGLVDNYYARYYIWLVLGAPLLTLLFVAAAMSRFAINNLREKR